MMECGLSAAIWGVTGVERGRKKDDTQSREGGRGRPSVGRSHGKKRGGIGCEYVEIKFREVTWRHVVRRHVR